jgi:hypothetical protein
VFSRLEDFRFARWAKGLNRSLQILFSLTLVAALNVLAATHFHRWDLTANRRFSLSPESLSYLGQIPHTPETPVQIFLILPENQTDRTNEIIRDQIRILQKEYAYEADHLSPDLGGPVPLTIDEIDPLRQGEKLKALEPEYTRMPVTWIMVVRGTRRHAITTADLYDTKQVKEGEQPTGFKGENAITSAILDVIQSKPDPILFTVGHGEMSVESGDSTSGLSNLGAFLKLRNYALGPINLANDKIPDDAKLVVVADPFVAFQPYEVEKLRRYLNDKNGRVLVFLEPGRDNGLDGLLEEWGLRSDDWIIEENRHYLTPDLQMVIDPSLDSKRINKLTQSLVLSGLPVVLGATRPVEIDDKAPADDRRKVQELLATSKYSDAALYADLAAKTPNFPTFEGPFSVAALSERGATDAVDLPGGRLLVFGNADFIANQNFQNYGNPELILNCVNYLANRENMLNIAPKAPHQTELDISTTAQFTGLAWRLAVVPAIVALLGLAVFWVRNRT